MSSVYTLSDPSPNGMSATEPILPFRQSARLQQKHLLNLASDSQSDAPKSSGFDPLVLMPPPDVSGVGTCVLVALQLKMLVGISKWKSWKAM